MLYEDYIIVEPRKFREYYAAQFNYDIAAMCNDLRASEQRNGHQTVSLSPKPYLSPSQFLHREENCSGD
jgi:hypothetical protein